MVVGWKQEGEIVAFKRVGLSAEPDRVRSPLFVRFVGIAVPPGFATEGMRGA